MTDQRVDNLFNKIVWASITGCVIFGVSKLDKMSDSIEKLNINIAVIVHEQGFQKSELQKHEERLKHLEGRK
jgi:hypothetical protein